MFPYTIISITAPERSAAFFCKTTKRRQTYLEHGWNRLQIWVLQESPKAIRVQLIIFLSMRWVSPDFNSYRTQLNMKPAPTIATWMSLTIYQSAISNRL